MESRNQSHREWLDSIGNQFDELSILFREQTDYLKKQITELDNIVADLKEQLSAQTTLAEIRLDVIKKYKLQQSNTQ